ncbi:hypothetical protein [Paenibacillus taichungensis]|uniref:hypothetical protein n=1 Tax=Paenibacillus taichungensis TaxID=484184 RepID=UPI0039A480E6
MISNTILELLHQYGNLIFYFAFSLGPFGIPIPNEITMISGAILSHTGVINSWITYFCILAGTYFGGPFYLRFIYYMSTGFDNIPSHIWRNHKNEFQ